MRKKATRREFMTTAGIGAAAMLDTSTVRSSAFLYGSTVGDLPMGSLSAWVTDNERRLTSVPPIAWKNPRDAVAQDAIIVRPDVKLQSMLGFGAALTDGSCYLFDKLAPAVREELFHILFHCGYRKLSPSWKRENLVCMPTRSAGETDRGNHSVAIQRCSESQSGECKGQSGVSSRRDCFGS
jgi:hypothetical protein